MEYGSMVNGLLIRHKTRRDGDKPIVYAETPVFEDGWRYSYHFEDTGDEITQVWDKTEDPGAHYEPEEPEATAEDYEEALGRFGV